MRFLLDTHVVIDLLMGRVQVVGNVKRYSPTDMAVSSIVMRELHYGAFRSARRSVNSARVDALNFAVLEFDTEDARELGEIRAALVGAGTPIGPYDVLFAGQARARSLTLVTANTREFARVANLHVEDWRA